MKISIVTVVYNNPLVKEALDSILSQDVDAEIELVVIDGGSTDRTLDVLEGYRDRLAVLVSEKDKGIYDAMNKGIARTTGDVVGILNSDDLYYDPRALAKVAEAFRDPATSVVYGDIIMVSALDTERVLRVWKSRPYRPGMFRRGWMPPHPAFFVRRQAYLDHGLFDPAFRTAADFDLMARFMEKVGLPSIHLEETLVRMRVGGASNGSVRRILKANLESYRAARKNGLRPMPWFIFMKILRKVPQFFQRAPKA